MIVGVDCFVYQRDLADKETHEIAAKKSTVPRFEPLGERNTAAPPAPTVPSCFGGHFHGPSSRRNGCRRRGAGGGSVNRTGHSRRAVGY